MNHNGEHQAPMWKSQADFAHLRLPKTRPATTRRGTHLGHVTTTITSREREQRERRVDHSRQGGRRSCTSTNETTHFPHPLPGSTVSTEHLTRRSAHAHFPVVLRVAQLFHISRFIQCTRIGSRLKSSSQHVSRVKSMSPIQENSFFKKNGYDENDNNDMSNETKCETNYSINNKWNNMRNKHFTKHDTNDDVDLDSCVVHTVR